MENDYTLATRIYRLLTGRLSRHEQQKLIDEAPMQQAMRQQWDAPHAERPDDETGKQIYRAIERRTAGSAAHSKQLWERVWHGYAAAIVIGLVVGAAGYLLWHQLFPATPSFITISATKPMHYLLPDSSTVWMRPGSSIRYAEAFLKNREIDLDGSALFEVTKDAHHPFRVHVDRATVEVKGTVFRVDRKAASGMYDISLFRGRIDFVVQESDQRTELLPSQTISYNPADGTTVRGQLANMVWKEGSLSFSNVRLDELTVTINKLYDINLTIAAGVAPETTFNGSIRANESIDEIISKICFILNLKKENIDDKNIILR
jgi:ferric-dicitrate binding protein FerR (iron transport regulator)